MYFRLHKVKNFSINWNKEGILEVPHNGGLGDGDKSGESERTPLMEGVQKQDPDPNDPSHSPRTAEKATMVT